MFIGRRLDLNIPAMWWKSIFVGCPAWDQIQKELELTNSWCGNWKISY